MNFKLILAILALMLTVTPVNFAHPNEVSGIVRYIIDGCTFELDGYGTVHLADVSCPPVTTAEGVHSREYSMEKLLNVQVFLDVDNNVGRDSVVYLYGRNDSPKLVPCYNRMIVDAGYAWVSDDAGNEFNPQDWWNETE